ncbi:hypothetical protein GGI25_001621 [Coemansia spiralis]|uniref:Uncharacterized protein n=2 Tax=Coemansia TaxID=4863 RepID=A0A9W8KZU4_9FUNG|nr:hypothetical protein BX070DRAFT_255186 [Coemansia spiralis]KAJ1991588.1 hypothetical protein EDC05_003353 [Coemansia umbellata]KAJ2623948.1 hypothetical protein GGI26_001963 [Coemansia sp. RSA 1358]KAJ2679265.1 hypothetical protein GGI25_001621 [Coemansia spiralis]
MVLSAILVGARRRSSNNRITAAICMQLRPKRLMLLTWSVLSAQYHCLYLADEDIRLDLETIENYLDDTSNENVNGASVEVAESPSGACAGATDQNTRSDEVYSSISPCTIVSQQQGHKEINSTISNSSGSHLQTVFALQVACRNHSNSLYSWRLLYI